MEEQLKVKIVADTSQFKNGMEKTKKELAGVAQTASAFSGKVSKATSNLSKNGGQMSKVIAGIGTAIAGITAECPYLAIALGAITLVCAGITKAIEGIIQGIKGLFAFMEEGSNISEVQNVIETTFGSMAGSVENFAKRASASFGLTELSAKQYMGTMGAMLKSMGLAEEQVLKMSGNMVALAGDMASFYNLDMQTAFDKIRSGISGETEPLKQLGINMSVANLEAFALAEGITKSYNAMTQAEQASLRYNYLMKTTADAQGDFAKTSTSWANQMKILENAFTQIKANVGAGLIQALTPALVVINKIVSALVFLSEVFSKVMSLLFGKNNSDTGLKEANRNSAGVADNMQESAEGAKATAKALKGLSGIDELNILSKSDSSGSGGSEGGGGGVIPFELDSGYEGLFDKIQSKVDSVVEKIKGKLKYIFGNFIEHIKKAKKALQPLLDSFSKNFSTVWKALKPVLVSIGGIILEIVGLGMDIIGICSELLVGFLKPFFPELKSIGDIITLVIVVAFKAVENVLGKIKIALEVVRTVLNKLSPAMVSAITQKAEALRVTFVLVHTVISNVITKIKELPQNIITTLKTKVDELKTAFNNVKTKIGEVKTEAETKFAQFKTFATNARNAINSQFQGIGTWFGAKFTEASNNIKTVFFWISNTATNGKNAITNLFSNIGNWFGSKFTEAYNKITSVFGSIGSWFQSIYNSIVGKFSAIGGSIGSAMSGAIKSIMNSAFATIETNINRGISFINSAIAIINKIPKVSIPTIKEISLPRLAKGGIVSSSTIAEIGERGKEAVLPLDRNTGWIDMLADRINGTGGKSEAKIILQLDSKVIGQASVDFINGQIISNGRIPLNI